MSYEVAVYSFDYIIFDLVVFVVLVVQEGAAGEEAPSGDEMQE